MRIVRDRPRWRVELAFGRVAMIFIKVLPPTKTRAVHTSMA